MTKTIGIDLGSKITVYSQGEGIIFREPSCILLDLGTAEPIAFGNDAVALNSRMPGCFSLLETFFEGHFTDYENVMMLFEVLFKKYDLFRSNIIAVVNSEMNEAEMRAMCDVFASVKAKSIGFVELPTVCVLGSGEDVSDNRAMISVNLGSGMTEMGLTKGCVTKYVHSVKYGCAKLDLALINYLKHKEGVTVTRETAKSIRETVGSLHPSTDVPAVDFRGFDSVTGLPLTLTLSSETVRNAMAPVADYIVKCIEALVRALPAQIHSEISERGILLSGGGALTAGFDTLISERLGLPVKVSPAPLDCTVNGLGLMIENQEVFKELIRDPEEYIEEINSKK